MHDEQPKGRFTMNKSRTNVVLLAVFLTTTLAVFGCGGDDETPTQLELQLDGLDPLGDGYVYEGWLIVDGAPVSSGRFTLGADSRTVVQDVDAGLAEMASLFVLTIEPATGDDPAPADTHVLAGEFSGGQASLDAAHAAALGDDFLGAGGGYILETPSTSMVSSDFDQGIWWLDPDGPRAGLMLPALPAGWVYEGWIVTGDGPVSTGRFDALDMADTDGAGATAGPDMAPPFPGQDLIDPAVSLVGTTVVISIEPEPDDSPAPFALKPLIDTVDDVAAGVLQAMDNHAADFPTGTATIR
jgi:hypothetical protein